MENVFRQRPWLVPVILALLTVILMRPVILPPEAGQVLNGHDFTNMFYPLQQTIQQTLKNGELPLWNPSQFLGHPFVGNPHAGLFYPAMWFIWVYGVQRGIGLMLVLHAWLGAWGMSSLIRRFGAGYVGSLLAGVIYAMSGWAGAHLYAGHYNFMLIAGLLPWAMVAYHYALERGTWAALLPGAALMGLALLAGHPPSAVYVGLGLVTLWVYHITQADDMWRAGVYATLRLAVIGIGGVILAAGLVLPALELASLAERNSNDLAFANMHALPPAQLLSALVLPDLYGSPEQEPYYYWGGDFYEEFNAYAGLLPLIAIPLAFRWQKRHRWYFIGLIAFGLVMSVGVEGALMPLLVRWVPGFGFFRVPARALQFVMMGMAGLLALLVTALQESTPDQRRDALQPAVRLWLPVGATAAFVLSVFFSGWYASGSHVEPMPLRASRVAGELAEAGVVACGVWLVLWLWTRPDSDSIKWARWLTVVLVIVDAWHVLIPIVKVGQVVEDPMWAGARGNVPAMSDRIMQTSPYSGPLTGASVTGHLSVQGYDPLQIDTFKKLHDAGEPDNPLSRVNQLMGVNYLMSHDAYEDPAFELVGIAFETFYYHRVDPFPRAWFPSEIRVEQNDDYVRSQIVYGDYDLQAILYVDEAVSCSPGENATAAISDYGANEVEITTGGGGGLLVLSDQYYPGWRASVDGEHVEITRADTVFRAVCVPPGDHTVRFEYRPLTFYAGTIITAIAWPLWLLLVLLTWWRRRVVG
ncbi:MAG: YfhO family protein [Anaerolineae bacterium]|nr:YfhO family protein [Anaerolineae bacterium]